MKSKFTVKRMAMVGIMAALTFAASQISFMIPTAVGNTRLHLGNVLCLMSGILLGPLDGGLAAGIGSMFYDFTNPIYISSAPFTLVFKFAMAFVCGKIVWRSQGQKLNHVGNNVISAAAGAFTYVVLYVAKNFFEDILFLRTEVQTALIDMAQKGAVSGVNAVLAVAVAVPLAMAVRKGLQSAGLYPKPAQKHS
ncbi:MAG: ECF transporter S component [Oscillospiraceae bacterium]|jgi:uncharacterized membrane protein|nr:ECF transporter S component [Oscillospiraceae bacterium]